MTFDEMRNDGREPQPTNGIICPKCGAGNLQRYGGVPLATGTIRRYRKCRNCGTPYVTSQPPERIVREVESKPDDEDERPVLKVRSA